MAALTKNATIWYGILNTFGRFRESDLPDDQKKDFGEMVFPYTLGQALGTVIRVIAGAIVVFLTTHDITGTVVSVLILVAGDTILTSTRKNS